MSTGMLSRRRSSFGVPRRERGQRDDPRHDKTPRRWRIVLPAHRDQLREGVSPKEKDELIEAIGNEARLEALRRTSLLDSPPEEAFDRLTRLATAVLHVPVALVSLVDVYRQFFKCQGGLYGAIATLRQLDDPAIV